MNDRPLVSIVVNNYNYGRFLREAIDSALRQTYRPSEVIVVDDGSTDDSRAIIAGYGGAVLAVLKANGGQASAFNAGFAHSRGEVVLFLDSDDWLLPDVVERVVAAFRAHPGVAKVQYRLAIVDAAGAPTGAVKPDRRRPMPSGDMRRALLAFPDDIPWQPTSGNAFPSWVLRRIFPVPEEVYRICADYYLSNLPPLFGEVLSLEEVGGCYRVHGSNNHHTAALQLDQIRQIVVRTGHTHAYIKAYADALGLADFPARSADVLAVTFLANRIILSKLDPGRHPIAGDTPPRLLVRGLRAIARRFDLPPALKALYALWFAAIAPAPRPLARWLAERFFFPERRGPLGRLPGV